MRSSAIRKEYKSFRKKKPARLYGQDQVFNLAADMGGWLLCYSINDIRKLLLLLSDAFRKTFLFHKTFELFRSHKKLILQQLIYVAQSLGMYRF